MWLAVGKVAGTRLSMWGCIGLTENHTEGHGSVWKRRSGPFRKAPAGGRRWGSGWVVGDPLCRGITEWVSVSLSVK